MGSGLVGLGHEVKMGSREANNPKAIEWAEKIGVQASHGTFAEAAAFGEVVFLCTSWEGTEHAIHMAQPSNMAGKVVVDVVNPLKIGTNGPELAIGYTDSAGELIQRLLPDAKVVKAFNIITAAVMVKPDLLGELPDMFICGNDAQAKKVVTDILTAFGWPPAIDMGGIEESRLLEPLGMLWIKYYFTHKTPSHAFKLIRK